MTEARTYPIKNSIIKTNVANSYIQRIVSPIAITSLIGKRSELIEMVIKTTTIVIVILIIIGKESKAHELTSIVLAKIPVIFQLYNEALWNC
jgi:hypothetical protein